MTCRCEGSRFESKPKAIEGALRELDLIRQQLKRKSDELCNRERTVVDAEERISNEVKRLVSSSIERQRADVQKTVSKCEQATVEVLRENRRLQTSLKSLVDANRALRSKVVALEAEAKSKEAKLEECIITIKQQNERIERLRSKLAVTGVKRETQQSKSFENKIGFVWNCPKCNSVVNRRKTKTIRQTEEGKLLLHTTSVSCSTQTENEHCEGNVNSSMLDQCIRMINFLIDWALSGTPNSTAQSCRTHWLDSNIWKESCQSARSLSSPYAGVCCCNIKIQQNLFRAATGWKGYFCDRDHLRTDRVRIDTLADLLVLNASDDEQILESTLRAILAGLADEKAKHEFLYTHDIRLNGLADPSFPQMIESCATSQMLSILEVAFCNSIHIVMRQSEDSEIFLLATSFAENLSILWQKFSRLDSIKSSANSFPALDSCLRMLVLDDVNPSDFLVINAKSILDNLFTVKT
ncbi:hypothetical protein BJ742DRAFT_738900 [Cladochytrium replicatum]|nr:hypothetical protein BJ742DRAFT_738900 [Cladochytrium replicatum]